MIISVTTVVGSPLSSTAIDDITERKAPAVADAPRLRRRICDCWCKTPPVEAPTLLPLGDGQRGLGRLPVNWAQRCARPTNSYFGDRVDSSPPTTASARLRHVM
ncbi:hypothetical protein JNB11_07460 [Kocuria palustris]|nr:hypothetical protein [Kocuria palustris]